MQVLSSCPLPSVTVSRNANLNVEEVRFADVLGHFQIDGGKRLRFEMVDPKKTLVGLDGVQEVHQFEERRMETNRD